MASSFRHSFNTSKAVSIPATHQTKVPSSYLAAAPTPTLTALPHFLLEQVFEYASIYRSGYPAIDRHQWPNSAWLLQVALLHRNFLDPALRVMYKNPPMHPPEKAHRLLQHLVENPKVGNGIRQIEIEVEPLLSKKTPGYGSFDLEKFLNLCPRARKIELKHVGEQPPYRNVADSRGYSYSSELLDVLAERHLESWHWNGEFWNQSEDLLKKVYASKGFSKLERLSFCYVNSIPGNDTHGQDLAELIATLPKLHTLKFEACEVVNAIFLAALAEKGKSLKLRQLRLINCNAMEAEPLREFLLSPMCYSLEVLEVSSSSKCSLEFMPALVNTPNLKSLTFNGTYYSTLATSMSADASPRYDALCPLDILPFWPPTLEAIKMTALRKWNFNQCEQFLQSLYEASEDLVRVRELAIHCSVDAGWKERAELRDKWVPTLTNAFVSPETKRTVPRVQYSSDVELSEPEVASPPKRRMGVRRSTRQQKLDEEAERREKEAEAIMNSAKAAMISKPRGKADASKVDVKFDNSRPSEFLFKEDDFAEASPVRAKRKRDTASSTSSRPAQRRKIAAATSRSTKSSSRAGRTAAPSNSTKTTSRAGKTAPKRSGTSSRATSNWAPAVSLRKAPRVPVNYAESSDSDMDDQEREDDYSSSEDDDEDEDYGEPI